MDARGFGSMAGFAESLVTYGSLERSTEAEGFRAAPFIAEFVGTFILVFTFGCVALSTAHLFWKPTAVACVVTVMIYSTATVSGGHLNPAVSLALTLQGVLPLCRMLGFWLVQLAGGVCAALTLRAMMGDGQILLRSMLPVMPYNLALVMLAELLYTALLCFLVSCCLVSKRNNPRGDHSQSFGLAIGLLYVAGGHALRVIAGGAVLNPAIAFGLASIMPGGMWYGAAWVLAELLGAVLGSRLFATLQAGSEDCPEEHLELCAPRMSSRLLGEALGTFTLVLTFAMNVINLSEATPWSSAAALISMIYALGKISGAHFNPAVTLAIVLSGRSKCSVGDGLAYTAVQACGGLAAGLLAAVYHANGPFASLPLTPLPFRPWTDFGLATVGIAEGVFTFVLAYVVLACATVTVPRDSKTRQNFYFGLAEGFCVMTGGCAVGPVSGGMLNPAVSVGVWMLNLAELHSVREACMSLALCVQLSAFQCAGGLIAAVVFRITHPGEYAKAPLLVR